MATERQSLDAVFFDFDGVIVESVGIKIQAFVDLYRPYGPAIAGAVAPLSRKLAGVDRHLKFKRFHHDLLGLDLSDAEAQDLCARYAALVETKVTKVAWVPGAFEFLKNHATRLPLFLVSATPDAELQRILSARRAAPYFRSAHGGPGRKGTTIEQLIDRHGFTDRSRLLMVGDGGADYEAAVETGIGFLGRVIAGYANPFPADVPTVPDLTTLTPEVRPR